MKFDGTNVYLTVDEFNKLIYALGRVEDDVVTINFRNPEIKNGAEPFDKLIFSVLWNHAADLEPYIDAEKGIYPQIEKIIIYHGE